MRACIRTFLVAWTVVASWMMSGAGLAAENRPNILWIVIEDMSPHFACYGETAIETPHLDRLAGEGLLFRNAFTTGPVCSASRSALITGMYQTSIGAHHHRSGRGTEKIRLPEGIRIVPELFQQAGYYTCNGSWPGGRGAIGKTDYNFEWNTKCYDAADWSHRKEGQPFFAQIQLEGGKLRERANWKETVERELESPTDPQRAELPPYLPSDPVILEDWAAYLDAVRYTDLQVGQILARLTDEGILDQTVIFCFTDHGISHVRAKPFCYDAGLRVPLIVRGMGVDGGEERKDLVEHIDVAASSLGRAGIPVPPSMQGRDLFADPFVSRKYAHAARDRCDETVDHIRSVRTGQFKYIRNFEPERPYLQPNTYKDNKPIVQTMRRLHAAGQLDAYQALIMAESRPPEELYDLEADPHELNNLATNRAYLAKMIEFRGELATWISTTMDAGRVPESPFLYESDMKVYIDGIARRDPERAREIEKNIALMRARRR
ncbi:MAG: sulfatase [Planctomycetes bacterium]|nr:sulfatase [Planctomycetota bacterium]